MVAEVFLESFIETSNATVFNVDVIIKVHTFLLVFDTIDVIDIVCPTRGTRRAKFNIILKLKDSFLSHRLDNALRINKLTPLDPVLDLGPSVHSQNPCGSVRPNLAVKLRFGGAEELRLFSDLNRVPTRILMPTNFRWESLGSLDTLRRGPPALRGGIVHQDLNIVLIFQKFRINNIYQSTHNIPLSTIGESFGVNVSCHLGRDFVHKCDIVSFESFIKPGNRHAMSSAQISHGGVPTCGNNINHRLIILMEHDRRFVGEQSMPKIKGRQATHTQTKVSRHDFSLRGRVTHTRLPLTLTRYREARIRPSN